MKRAWTGLLCRFAGGQLEKEEPRRNKGGKQQTQNLMSVAKSFGRGLFHFAFSKKNLNETEKTKIKAHKNRGDLVVNKVVQKDKNG